MIRKSYLAYLKKAITEQGLLRATKYPFRYLGTYLGYKLNKSVSGPIQGTLCITYNCNLRCEMCDLPQRHQSFKEAGKSPYKFEEWKKIIKSFAEIGTSGMAISGGEPFLNKDLFSIIREVKKQKMVCQMTTNGWFIDEVSGRELIETGIDTITISIDGSDPELHDKIRGINGSFDKALSAVKILVLLRKELKANFKINISTVFGKSNYKNIDKIIDITKNAGADCIGFIPVHTIAPEVNKDLSLFTMLETEEIKEVISSLIIKSKEDNYIETSESYFNMFYDFFDGKPLPMSCLAGFTTLIIDCYGDIFPCFSFYEMKKSWGNLKEFNDLNEFWKSHSIESSRSEIKECRECFWNCQVETNLLYKIP